MAKKKKIESKWLKKARKEPHSVQLVVPKLDLPKAGRVLCRNMKTKQLLEEMGFQNSETKRIPLER